MRMRLKHGQIASLVSNLYFAEDINIVERDNAVLLQRILLRLRVKTVNDNSFTANLDVRVLELVSYPVFTVAFYLKGFLSGFLVACSVSGEVARRAPVSGVVKLLKVILRDGSGFVEWVFQQTAEEGSFDTAQRFQFLRNSGDILVLRFGGFHRVQFCLHRGDSVDDIRSCRAIFLCNQIGAERVFPVSIGLVELRQRLVRGGKARFGCQNCFSQLTLNFGFHPRQFRLPFLDGCVAFACTVCFCLVEAVLIFVVNRVGFALLKLPFLQGFVQCDLRCPHVIFQAAQCFRICLLGHVKFRQRKSRVCQLSTRFVVFVLIKLLLELLPGAAGNHLAPEPP